MPPVQVEIVDYPGIRLVKLPGPYRQRGRLVKKVVHFETTYSRALVEQLADIVGLEWLKDEIDRSEDRGYVAKSLETFLLPYTSLKGMHVLDFGCGCGATTVILGRMGARVVGVDPSLAHIEVANMRLKELGLMDTAAVVYVSDTSRLPMATESFDVIVCYQVLEHIPGPARSLHLLEMWRVLRKGGCLFVSAPNRIWPIEFHTTNLWWVPYLPWRLAYFYACLRGRLSFGLSKAAIWNSGLKGITYWEVINALPASTWVVKNAETATSIERYFALSLSRPQSKHHQMAKQMVAYTLKMLEQSLLRRIDLPALALLPYVILCIRKV